MRDFDAPRDPEDDLDHRLRRDTRTSHTQLTTFDPIDPVEEEDDLALLLPDRDPVVSRVPLTEDDMLDMIVPMGKREFQCPRCFLVQHINLRTTSGVCQGCT